jgi:hypothetical protein
MGRRKIGSFGLVNYRRHPENPNYIVFGFNSTEEAAIFEKELTKSKISFEKDKEETEDGTVYLFAVAESSMDEALSANGVVHIAKRDPLLKNNFIRYALIIFVLFLSALAIIGYVKNSHKVSGPGVQIESDSTKFAE